MINVSENTPRSFAGKDLCLLREIDAELSRFLDAEDEISTEEITELFSRINDRMTCLRQLGLSNVSGLTEEQLQLIRRVLEQMNHAYQKAERLSAGCRAGLRGVQQKKWICAQFATQSLKPGSLLDYSEKLQTPKNIK